MFSQILGINSNNLLQCRACLCNNGTFLSIYDENLAQIFQELTSIQVSENDFLPKELCSICASRLRDFKNFRELCLGSHITLTSLVSQENYVNLLTIEVTSELNNNNIEKCQQASELIPNYSKEIVIESKDEIHELPENTQNYEIITNNDTKINFKEQLEITHEVKDEILFHCDHCSKKFRRKLSLLLHLKASHFSNGQMKRKQLKCPYATCSKRFFYKQSILESHIRSHSSKKLKIFILKFIIFPLHVIGPRPEICPHCKKSFPDHRCLKQHLLTHSAIKNFHCHYCEKAFRASHLLSQHENAVHTKSKTFNCDECNLTFYTRNNLLIHKINRHSDLRPYKCDECQKAFKFRSQLKDHVIRHRKIKNVPCPDCKAMFVMEKDVKIHQRLIHRRNYRFECADCGRKFQVKSQLTEHERTHTGERPYICSFCGKGFQKPGTLKKHVFSHTGERPYKCKECPKAYTELFILKRHIRNQHDTSHKVTE
uniref:CSON005866 protein n=1 Tax=Culicoides sonorensis TaxID=179676 RepID=A0A336M7M3_CULSO